MTVYAPRGTGSSARTALRAAVRTLEAMGEDPALSVGALRLYASGVDALATVRAEWIAAGRPVLGAGSHGQEVRHPLLSALEAQEAHVSRLAEGLLLTPKARKAARSGSGWAKGSPRAQDRRPGLVRVLPTKGPPT